MTASGASIGRTHEIADLDIGGADPSRERRADRGVAFLDLQIVERGLIGLDGAGQDVGLGLGVIDIDLRGGALADQIAVAADVALRAFELGLILGQHALGLFDLGVDLARVEREQQIAFVDLGAVLEMHRDDGGFEPRFQRHAGNRRHHSDRVDIDGHRLALRLGQLDRDHARALRPWALALPPIHDERVTKRGRRQRCRWRRPKVSRLRFFIIFHACRSVKGRDGSILPLDGDFCALFLNGYHSLAAHGMPLKRKCVVTIRDLFMRIATWNVNSIRQRLDHLLTWLKDCSPDVVCLQEIKCVDEAFPRLEIEALGYNVVTHGQKTFNGVALLSKLPFDETKSGLAGDDEDAHARFLEGVVTLKHGVMRIACLYLPNGNPPETEKYPYKLKWMSRLLEYSKERLKTEEPLVLAGDFNVIPAAAGRP